MERMIRPKHPINAVQRSADSLLVSAHLSQSQAEPRSCSLSGVSKPIHQPFKGIFQLICLQYIQGSHNLQFHYIVI